MSKTTLTLLTEGTVWDTFRPKIFSCTFSEDTSIAYIDFFSGSALMQRLMNVESGVNYEVRLPLKLTKIFFVPDDVLVEKKLRITDIQFDANYIFTDNDPNRVEVILEDGKIAAPVDTITGITFLNGVGSGAADLVPNVYVGMAVAYRGAIIGYVISNTTTTVTLDRGYTDSTPRTYQFYTRYGTKLLTFACVNQELFPPYPFASLAGAEYYTAPPWPFNSEASAVQKTSNVPVSVFISAATAQAGLPFSVEA